MRHVERILVMSALLLQACHTTGSSLNTAGSTLTDSVSQATSASTAVSTSVSSLKEDIVGDNSRSWYEIFVRSFCDSNGDQVGDLNGIDSKLSYLRDLGFTGLWLTPIFKSSSEHKYNTDDYFTIDPEFGTMDDLKKLVKDAHQLGIKVILDGVFNHTGRNIEWFSKAELAHQKKLKGETLTEEESHYQDLYVFFDSEEDARNAVSTGKINAYYRAGGNDFYYEGNFSSDMPELNYDEELSYTLVQSVIDYYMKEVLVDGFRLDATTYYYYENTAKNVQVLSRFKAMVKANNPDAYVVGECFKGASIIKDYYASGIDSFFYFPGATSSPDSFIFTSLQDDKLTYLSGLKKLLDTVGTGIAAPFLDNHDIPRATKAKSPEKTKFQYGLLAMISGATFTYYGDEIGMTSSNNSPVSDGNYRTHYYWDDTTHEGECIDVSTSQMQTEYYPDSKTQSADPGSILNYVRKANLLRNALPALSHGSFDPTNATDSLINKDSNTSLLSLTKTYKDTSLQVLINFSPTDTMTIAMPSGKAVKASLVLDPSDDVSQSDTSLAIPSYGMVFLA